MGARILGKKEHELFEMISSGQTVTNLLPFAHKRDQGEYDKDSVNIPQIFGGHLAQKLVFLIVFASDVHSELHVYKIIQNRFASWAWRNLKWVPKTDGYQAAFITCNLSTTIRKEKVLGACHFGTQSLLIPFRCILGEPQGYQNQTDTRMPTFHQVASGKVSIP